jgi:hypothetical protein
MGAVMRTCPAIHQHNSMLDLSTGLSRDTYASLFVIFFFFSLPGKVLASNFNFTLEACSPLQFQRTNAMHCPFTALSRSLRRLSLRARRLLPVLDVTSLACLRGRPRARLDGPQTYLPVYSFLHPPVSYFAYHTVISADIRSIALYIKGPRFLSKSSFRLMSYPVPLFRVMDSPVGL